MKRGVGIAFFDGSSNPRELVEQIKILADKARKKGLLVLEDEPVDNVFFKKGIQLCVDGQTIRSRTRSDAGRKAEATAELLVQREESMREEISIATE